MPYSYVQAGRTLQRLDTNGTASEITLPDELILNQDRTRSATLDRRVCVVNSPSHNFMMLQGDPVTGSMDEAVSMSPVAPKLALNVAESGIGDLTGTYKYKCSFLIKDSKERVVAESPTGPESAAISPSNQGVTINAIPVAVEPSINSRRIYRTLTGGTVYFHLRDVDGNGEATIIDSQSDESIALASGPNNLGNPPGSYGASTKLELITAWKGRLFGRAGGAQTAIDKDILLWSEIRRPYAWPDSNTLPIPPVGADTFGITAFIPRRDKLGIGKRDAIYAITDPTPLEGQLRRIASIGVVAPDSVVIRDDVAWFLSEDGVYEWGSQDIVRNVSVNSVHPWFTTDKYFNRGAFEDAIGFYHEERESIVWLLPGRDDAVLSRWVEFYPSSGVWLGPHLTDEFTPTYVSALEDAESVATFVFGGADGRVYQESMRGYDGATEGPLSSSQDSSRRSLLYSGVDIDGSSNTFVEVPIGVPTNSNRDGHIVISLEDSPSPAIAHFPWAVLSRVDPAAAGDTPSPSDSLSFPASIGDDSLNILVGRTAADTIMIAATEDIFPVDILIYSVDPGLDPTTIIPRGDGVEVSIKTQPQTAGEPDRWKHWGELSLQADIGAGHGLEVTTSVDGMNEKTHTSPESIEDRVRLPRIGDGNRMVLEIKESTTAPFRVYGYNISPVNIIGRR